MNIIVQNQAFRASRKQNRLVKFLLKVSGTALPQGIGNLASFLNIPGKCYFMEKLSGQEKVFVPNLGEYRCFTGFKESYVLCYVLKPQKFSFGMIIQR